MDPVATICGIVGFVLVTVVVTGFSHRLGWSAPLLLVVVGAIVAYVPGVPRVELDPEVVLYGVLPPLLFATAIRTSFHDVRARQDSILLLSIGLVAFSTIAVGLATWLVVPAVSLAAAFAFGAAVAPTDTAAVTAIAGRLHLPRRVVTVLEGESLFNDATALVALNAAITAIVAQLSPVRLAGDFALAVLVGLAFGLGVGGIIALVRRRLRSPVLDTSISLMTPYVAFIPAELLHGSGALAVVVAGLFLGFRAPSIQTAQARIAESINWRTISFLLENAVFLLIGLNLPWIVQGAASTGLPWWQVALICAAVLIAVWAARLLWTLGTTALYHYGPNPVRRRRWTWPTGIAIGAAGIRGVVTLVAVLLLPEQTPGRAFLQFLALVVVVGTLLQGLTLPAMIRMLRLPPPNFMQEDSEMLRLLAEVQAAGLARLEDVADEERDDARVLERLRLDDAFLVDIVDGGDPEVIAQANEGYRRLRYTMITAEREAALAARSEGRYESRALRQVLAYLDAQEAALRASASTRHKKSTDPGL